MKSLSEERDRPVRRQGEREVESGCLVLSCDEGPGGDILHHADYDAAVHSRVAEYVRKALSSIHGEGARALTDFDAGGWAADGSPRVVVVVLHSRESRGAAAFDEAGWRTSNFASSPRMEVAEPAGPAWADAAEPSLQIPVAQFPELTPRQKDVLRMILEGNPNKIIAAELGISMRTVENHRASIMKKTRSKSLSALVRFAIAAGQLGVSVPATRQ